MNRGLIERRVYCVRHPERSIRVEELWDLRVPGCPWVKIPVARYVVFFHHVYHMTQQQYQYHTRDNWRLLS